jgi:hypothetical protein
MDEKDRLDDLQDRIDDTREDLAEMTGTDDEPRFIDRGEASDEAVDDTIAPPG